MEFQKYLSALPIEPFQNLRFGIREKITILVVAVAVVVAMGTSYSLQRVSAHLVERHELVDLGDEANLRAWEIVDRVNQLESDLRTVVEDEEIQLTIYADDPETPGKPSDAALSALDQRCAELTDQWENYLRVDVVEATKEWNAIPVHEMTRDIEGQVDLAAVRASLVQEAECLPSAGTVLLVSTIHRMKLDLHVPPEDPQRWKPMWVPVVMACARVEPHDPNWEPARYLVFTMKLDPPASPRHLFFLVDASSSREPYVMHPNMAIEEGFKEEVMFEHSLFDLLLIKRVELAQTDQRNRLERLDLLRSVPMEESHFYHFREGRPTRTVQEKLDELEEQDPELHAKFRANITGAEESSDRQIGGMNRYVPEIRLLAADKDDVMLSKRSEDNFIGLVEEDLRDYTGVSRGTKLVDWDKTLTCKHCHIACVDFYIDTVEGRRNYLLMYAAFHEEFVGAINQGINSALVWWVFAFGGGALVLASFVAILFVQPMHAITETAQQVASDEGHLHEKLSKLNDDLPIHRADEVGDIARAARKLFDEVLSSHDLMEKRVDERTQALKEAYEQLESLGKQKDAFLANVSHELRTPLTAVSGFLQLLKRRNLEDRSMKYVVKALAGAAHLEVLIDDILDFQKIIMGGITLSGEEFEVCHLLTEVTEGLQFNAGKNGNTLKSSCADDLTTINTDRQRLRQVLFNLISNACKFTHQGVIKVEASTFKNEADDAPESWVRFRVIDSGRGMSKEEQHQLFTRFYTNKKANQSGTGLGLVISQELGKLMGGRVFLERSAPGEGTTFTIEIPQTLPETPTPSSLTTTIAIDGQDTDR